MRIRLTKDEAEFLLGALDIWIEGYQDIGDEADIEVVPDLLSARETSQQIRDRVARRLGYDKVKATA